MSKKHSPQSKSNTVAGFEYITKKGGIEEYRLKKNRLRILYKRIPKTGVVTTNITYLVGAKDELRGETGIAHMLEHMLFKPTTFDKKAGITEGSAMLFERETGCNLNANTWKDRTSYYFNYPVEYFDRALRIEAERMTGVVLNQKELTPEQGNVLSEFDMYNGNPHFALQVQMVSTAFHSHPYGHETIGYREDIEDYTPEKLERFYRQFYRPENAVLMVVGDIDLATALSGVKKHFGSILNPTTVPPAPIAREPKQEGVRRVTITRPSTTNLVAIGFKHAPFPTDEWYQTYLLLEVLTGGPESILHQALIDTGLATKLDYSLEPTNEENLASLEITLAPGITHEAIEQQTLKIIRQLTEKSVASLLKKAQAKEVTDELYNRTSSLNITRELTEFVASGDWTKYATTISQLQQVTAKHVRSLFAERFTDNNLTVGYFIGK